MGRSDILELLEKNPDKWFDVKELSKMLEVSTYSISRCIRQITKMQNQTIIDFKFIDANQHNKKIIVKIKDEVENEI